LVKVFKTPIITNKPVFYNGFYFYLSTDENLINLNIVYEGVNEVVCVWDSKTLYKSFLKKNYNSKMKKEELIQKINISKLGVKFNVSQIKDHGTLWKFIDRKF
jgi:hypothetical protein